MATTLASLLLASPDATCQVARRLGALVRPGDTLLLDGGIGAGKTHFARCLIQSLLTEVEDVPSPTFTLVQTYDARPGTIWHADLYRLAGPDDVAELGLDQALGHDICLIEWPDRLGRDLPADALALRFEVAGNSARRLTIAAEADPWRARIEEAELV